MNGNLVPFQGTLDKYKAAHLLRRTLFGVKIEEINQSVEIGLEATVDMLLESRPHPDPPITYAESSDPNLVVGTTWVDKGYVGSMPIRINSLSSWIHSLMLEDSFSVREKMVLFWLNHFGIGRIRDARLNYTNNDLVRTYSIGNFKTLVQKMTIDGAMLYFLNGNANTRSNPNENFSRELLELYTIGKGAQVGVGDYTNYTDHDVIEISKALSGWRALGQRKDTLEIFFERDKHDTSTKKLSHRFDEIEIENQYEEEYKTVIDIIFSKEEVSRFICRKLYRWFVHHEISPEIDTTVIEPLAEIMLQNNYEVKPVLRALLTSQRMFSEDIIGCIVKSPLDFTLGTIRTLEIENQEANIIEKYFFWHSGLNVSNIRMQMELYECPSVAGWKAYYQEPTFSKIWLNSVTLNERMDFIDHAIDSGFEAEDIVHIFQPLEFLKKLSLPIDINSLLDELALLLFSYPLNENEREKLKELLIPGLPDFEWTVEYGEYASDPDDKMKADLIERKVRNLVLQMLKSPEYLIG